MMQLLIFVIFYLFYELISIIKVIIFLLFLCLRFVLYAMMLELLFGLSFFLMAIRVMGLSLLVVFYEVARFCYDGRVCHRGRLMHHCLQLGKDP